MFLCFIFPRVFYNFDLKAHLDENNLSLLSVSFPASLHALRGCLHLGLWGSQTRSGIKTGPSSIQRSGCWYRSSSHRAYSPERFVPTLHICLPLALPTALRERELPSGSSCFKHYSYFLHRVPCESTFNHLPVTELLVASVLGQTWTHSPRRLLFWSWVQRDCSFPIFPSS